ncbi:Cdc6/Cdc18 family protein [Halosegnis rubeus]|uniref:ORC1-type DNA replication protein n=1 Tax=Halosegnis rubeus TaxID=2212850 RepID=A0A5N5UHG3_9EURY|nr:AAA family ATPase [Halosegnis rubeus]KAB7517961.1 AAA family ATPase [Halosegnis rubeus]
MTDYDDLFAETAPDESVFADKQALDPLQPPDTIRGRDEHQRQIAGMLNGVTEGYLPPTVTIHGPPGTGKTVTTRRVCQEFAARHDSVAVEYVNLKECRSIFSAAREINLELTGESVGAYEGVDGAFTGIWEALADYPAWTVLILDEIDQIKQDANYDPSDFLYRLLRGEGKLKRDIQLSAWLISNELVEVDLRLDSRVESAMSDEAVFFGPYGHTELLTILSPRLERAFVEGACPEDVVKNGVSRAAHHWGDIRKTLTLFRHAGELANERGLDAVTIECLTESMEATEKDTTSEKLLSLPTQHFLVLLAAASLRDQRTGELVQPVTSGQLHDTYTQIASTDTQVGERARREILTDLETMGLINTWIDSRGSEGRVKQIETTFDPEWVSDVREQFIEETPGLSTEP